VTGFYGQTGIQGETGISLGETGIQGVTGILGLDGETGIQGVTGLIGGTGIQGITGLANFIETDANPLPPVSLVPVLIWASESETVYVGITGLAPIQVSGGALKGDYGQTGISGVTGLIGGTGIRGVTGITAATGIQGTTGFYGQTGIQGVTGILGTSGGTGIRGETGIQGTFSAAYGGFFESNDATGRSTTLTAAVPTYFKFDPNVANDSSNMSVSSVTVSPTDMTCTVDGTYYAECFIYGKTYLATTTQQCLFYHKLYIDNVQTNYLSKVIRTNADSQGYHTISSYGNNIFPLHPNNVLNMRIASDVSGLTFNCYNYSLVVFKLN
jgi:hypothetical protein